jgi:hypothetical protein
MLYSPLMPTVPAYVIDALNGLLEAEANSIFRFVEDGSPYLGRATAEVRRTLREMAELGRRHQRELADLIDSLDGVPIATRGLRPDEQYLSYLSLQFLLPKLVNEKELIIRRYQNAQQAIGHDFPRVSKLLSRMIAEQQPYLDMLRKAAHEVTGGKAQGIG